MKFRTEIQVNPNKKKIEHHHKILTIGSCFAENISEYFKYYRFSVLENPFGVLYNPVSIKNSLELVEKRKVFTNDDLIFDQGEWHSFYHHSDFSHHDPGICLNTINNRLIETSAFLRKTGVVIISFGTVYIYNHKEKNITVSNCHKIPQNQFEKNLMPLTDVVSSIKNIVELIQKLTKNAVIIFTVSPVRHTKNGFVENQLSKSILIVGVHEVISKNKNCFYFPSYEIMMDDLRDYRYYDSDMIHPNKIAAGYIWEKFRDSTLSDECKLVIQEIEKISRARNHRIRNPQSPKNREFVNSILKQIEILERKHPHLNLSDDKNYFKSLL